MVSLSRRESFEKRLLQLQGDITVLTDKIADPAIAADSAAGKKKDGTTHGTTSSSSSTTKELRKHNASKEHKKDFDIIMHERNDAEVAIEKQSLEIIELRQQLSEAQRFKLEYDRMKQDLDSTRISLESSERIRKQQKALIALIQKSSTIQLDGKDDNGLSYDDRSDRSYSTSSSRTSRSSRSISSYSQSQSSLSRPENNNYSAQNPKQYSGSYEGDIGLGLDTHTSVPNANYIHSQLSSTTNSVMADNRSWLAKGQRKARGRSSDSVSLLSDVEVEYTGSGARGVSKGIAMGSKTKQNSNSLRQSQRPGKNQIQNHGRGGVRNGAGKKTPASISVSALGGAVNPIEKVHEYAQTIGGKLGTPQRPQRNSSAGRRPKSSNREITITTTVSKPRSKGLPPRPHTSSGAPNLKKASSKPKSQRANLIPKVASHCPSPLRGTPKKSNCTFGSGR